MTVKMFEFTFTQPKAWTAHAECAKFGAPGMFPSEGDTEGIRWARETCAVCPVRRECLTEALESGEQYGVWGGLTTAERTELRNRNARQARKRGGRRKTMAELADVADLAGGAE